ncbi:uncharacterized protein I206_102116 [Kwoniella pini CBS 10737]|uniref:Uncharacterized protein n=1 Tax=Kwoniella pini CBS 10737 TaxID=1296096 RepID=A0A1B9HUS0_9TREE|nr:uncharacterized protein I206_06791 [Kwoniella pini CBS 10737]OCF47017.1 hypothetical protein I206_06791 [Kwoniella pini CBS 10737]
MPTPTHLKPLHSLHKINTNNENDKVQKEIQNNNENHPLSKLEPISPIRKVQNYKSHSTYELVRTQHRYIGDENHSPEKLESQSNENENSPMLVGDEQNLNQLNQNNVESNFFTENDQIFNLSSQEENAITNDQIKSNSPKSSNSLFQKLLNTLLNEPTISKTWEKKIYTTDDSFKVNPLVKVNNELNRKNQFKNSNSNSNLNINSKSDHYTSTQFNSRPISFYASPAELASFKPLPNIIDQQQ